MSTSETPAHRPPPPYGEGDIIGDYRIERLLGRGGMGFVYGAVNTMIGKRAAIKVLARHVADHDMVERFITEARAVNQIGHPNIVDIFAFGTTDRGDKYMVMEWLRGESLADRMERPLAQAEICDHLLTIVSALEAAHAAGIVHRDLKPENVFLHDPGTGPVVKLLDFGIAKLLAPDDGRLGRTRTGFLMGTPAYMSPEQARGKDVDHRSDIYSLGVIAFELFTGSPPFLHDTPMDLVVAHMHEPPRVPSMVRPGVSPAIDSVVLSMLEKHAAARPPLGQVAAALRAIRAGKDELGTMPPRPAVTGSEPTVATGEVAASVVERAARSVSTIGLASGQTSVPPQAPARRRGTLYAGIAAALVGAVASFALVSRGRGEGDEVVPRTGSPTLVSPPTVSADRVIPPGSAAAPVSAPTDRVAPVPTPTDPASTVAAPTVGAATASPTTTRSGHRGGHTGASAAVSAPTSATTSAAAPTVVPAPVATPTPTVTPPVASPTITPPVAPPPPPPPTRPADRDGTIDPFAHH
ncbi:MAG: protein kinase [Deltaproteobacteria bacterium]|nr:protein kinase [Deltaproteobacteria bacterium]